MIDLEAAKRWHSMSLWGHGEAKNECLSIFPAALSEIEALRKVAEAAKFEAAPHDAITGPCDCVLCKALSDAGYGDK